MCHENTDTISVIIPAYNVDKYIARAIDSVLAQTRLPDEVIVVDDGSTDNTAGIVKGYGSHIRYIYQQNAGPSTARNTGIKAANSKWIAFLDADDEWLPEKLQLQMELLKQNNELVWVCCNYTVHYCKTKRKCICSDPGKIENLLKGQKFFGSCFEAINHGVSLSPIGMIVQRQVLEEAGLFQDGLNYCEEYDLWWKIGYHWPKVGYINHPLVVCYAQRPESLTVSTDRVEIMNTLSDVFERHLELSSQYGKQDLIKPFIIQRLRKWSYNLYRIGQFQAVRKTLTRFDYLLPWRYKLFMRISTLLPNRAKKIGMRVLHILSYDKFDF